MTGRRGSECEHQANLISLSLPNSDFHGTPASRDAGVCALPLSCIAAQLSVPHDSESRHPGMAAAANIQVTTTLAKPHVVAEMGEKDRGPTKKLPADHLAQLHRSLSRRHQPPLSMLMQSARGSGLSGHADLLCLQAVMCEQRILDVAFVPAGKRSRWKQPSHLHQVIYRTVQDLPVMVLQCIETGPGWLSVLLWGSYSEPEEGCSTGSISPFWEGKDSFWRAEQTVIWSHWYQLFLTTLHEHKSPCNG